MGLVSYVGGINTAPLISASVPRIDMSAADRVAAAIPGLVCQVSGRRATGAGAELDARCRVTGTRLVPVGPQAGLLTRRTVAGRQGISNTGAPTTSGGGYALRLPPQATRDSFTIVMPVAMSAEFMGGPSSLPCNLLARYTAAGTAAAYYAYPVVPALVSPSDGLRNFGHGTTTAKSVLALGLAPANTWSVLAVAVDLAERTIHASPDGVNWTSVTDATMGALSPMDYLTLGLMHSSSSLQGNTIGDVYVYDSCLRSSAVGQAHLSRLVGALRGDYGIS